MKVSQMSTFVYYLSTNPWVNQKNNQRAFLHRLQRNQNMHLPTNLHNYSFYILIKKAAFLLS